MTQSTSPPSCATATRLPWYCLLPRVREQWGAVCSHKQCFRNCRRISTSEQTTQKKSHPTTHVHSNLLLHSTKLMNYPIVHSTPTLEKGASLLTTGLARSTRVLLVCSPPLSLSLSPLSLLARSSLPALLRRSPSSSSLLRSLHHSSRRLAGEPWA